MKTEIYLGLGIERAPATALGVRKRRARTGAPATAGARAVVGWCPGDLVRPVRETEWRLGTMLLLLCCQRHEDRRRRRKKKPARLTLFLPEVNRGQRDGRADGQPCPSFQFAGAAGP